MARILHWDVQTVLSWAVLCMVSAQTKYKVTTIVSPPYTMPDPKTGNLIGLIPDVLDHIKTVLNVDFDVKLVKDGRYGSKQPNGTWTGMIGELNRNESDIAAAPITVSALRAGHVDFSYPFMDIGLKILTKRQQTDSIVIESSAMFFKPLQTGVWIAIIIAYVIVTMVMYVVARFNPEESVGENDDDHHDHLPLTTTMFMMFSMLSLQGFRLTPTSAAGRILVCSWWIFGIVIIAMYTASLASQLFLSLPSQEEPLHFYTFKQLANQRAIQYGCVKSGSIFSYFNNSNGETEKTIAKYFTMNPQVLVQNTDEGVARVRDGNYAFIMESEAAYYVANQRPCDLTVTGEPLGDKDYAFACRAGTDMCGRLNQAIIQLLESGEMRRLRNQWMDGGCGSYESLAFGQHFNPPTIGDIEVARSVDLKRFTAPLVLLTIGIVITTIATVIEMLRSRRSRGGVKGRRLPEDRSRIDTPADAEIS